MKMKRSNLIPITRIYDIYPKYTYSEDVKKFMDEIVDIDRVNVYTEDEVMECDKLLGNIRAEIEQLPTMRCTETYRRYIDAASFKKNVLAILDKYKVESENKDDK